MLIKIGMYFLIKKRKWAKSKKDILGAVFLQCPLPLTK